MTAVGASDAPARRPGTRGRSGNAMLRTRAAILAAAARTVERYGVRRSTMSDIAAVGGVAKATLYNHFRTKDDVLAALVEAEVGALGALARERAAAEGLAAGLALAGQALAANPALRRVAADEPALLLPLLAPGEGRGWAAAWSAVADLLEVPADDPAVALVLRWLLAQLLWPATAEQAEAHAHLLAAAVGVGGPGEVPVATVAAEPAVVEATVDTGRGTADSRT